MFKFHTRSVMLSRRIFKSIQFFMKIICLGTVMYSWCVLYTSHSLDIRIFGENTEPLRHSIVCKSVMNVNCTLSMYLKCCSFDIKANYFDFKTMKADNIQKELGSCATVRIIAIRPSCCTLCRSDL